MEFCLHRRGENIQERLVKHIRDYSSEKEKYYWNTAVLFVGRDLNKALIRYLENRLRDNFDPDELEEKKKWLLISFQGDLANGLLDSEALEVTEFNVKIC